MQYDTLPTGLPDWDGTGIDDFDLPDYMFKDPIHYSEEWFKFIEEKVKDEDLADEYKQIMINIMHKKYGVDVRLSLAIFIYIIAHGFTVTLKEFQHLTDKLIERMGELEKSYQDLLDEWKNTLAGVTVDSEVINARIDLHGFVNKTLKERLDTMQAMSDKLNPVSEVFTIEHNQYGYPSVRVLALSYGLGVVPLESEPDGLFGGSTTVTINCDAEYLDRNTLTVKVPLAYTMTNPTVERISANEYLLVEGVRSLVIEVGTKAEANVETFVNRTITSDFTGKKSGSVVENAHIIKGAADTSLIVPSKFVYEHTDERYEFVKKKDGSFQSLDALGQDKMYLICISYNVLWILEQNFPSIFKSATTTVEKVAIAKRSLTGNVLSVWGKGSGPSGNLLQMKVLNSSGTWSSVTSENSTNTIKGIGTSFFDASRITNEGKLHVLVHSEASNGIVASSVSVDYTDIELTARVPFQKY